MLPVNYSFMPGNKLGILMLQQVQGAVTAVDISAKTKIAYNKIRFTMASDPLATKWSVGMQMMLRTSGNANIRALDIVQLDHTNNYVICECPAGDVNGIIANATIANGIQWGTVNLDLYDNGTRLLNNKNELLAIQYNVDGHFLIRKTDRDLPVIFQMKNTHASTATTSATVEISLNGVDWHPCPTALALGALAAGESGMLIFDYPISCWVRLNVDSNSATYYVLGV